MRVTFYKYIILATCTYGIFVIFFAVIVDRFSRLDPKVCAARCSTKDDWFTKHGGDSYDQFWGCALTLFFLGAYAIIGGVYCYNNPEDVKEAVEEKKDEKKA